MAALLFCFLLYCVYVIYFRDQVCFKRLVSSECIEFKCYCETIESKNLLFKNCFF